MMISAAFVCTVILQPNRRIWNVEMCIREALSFLVCLYFIFRKKAFLGEKSEKIGKFLIWKKRNFTVYFNARNPYIFLHILIKQLQGPLPLATFWSHMKPISMKMTQFKVDQLEFNFHQFRTHLETYHKMEIECQFLTASIFREVIHIFVWEFKFLVR